MDDGRGRDDRPSTMDGEETVGRGRWTGKRMATVDGEETIDHGRWTVKRPSTVDHGRLDHGRHERDERRERGRAEPALGGPGGRRWTVDDEEAVDAWSAKRRLRAHVGRAGGPSGHLAGVRVRA
jgi:hypothetical protein